MENLDKGYRLFPRVQTLLAFSNHAVKNSITLQRANYNQFSHIEPAIDESNDSSNKRYLNEN